MQRAAAKARQELEQLIAQQKKLEQEREAAEEMMYEVYASRNVVQQAFDKWLTTMASQAKLLNGIANLRAVGMRKALNTWQAKALEGKEAFAKLRAASTSMRNLGARKAVNQWIQMATESAEAKAKLSAAAMSMRNIGSSKAFNQWAEMASEAAEAKAKLSAAAMSMKKHRLAARHSISGRRWRASRRKLRQSSALLPCQ